ncbi:DUF6894 family protein, partial [Methylobacterium trifolii]|uniref:DUF6894 family protein n=1 Tax=Methylobacterium trifolii TaxID=1003092 RepID=UPI002795D4A5
GNPERFNGAELIEDPEGLDLLDLAAARAEALAGARDILANSVRKGEPLDGQRIEIANAAGELLATVAFKDAITVV